MCVRHCTDFGDIEQVSGQIGCMRADNGLGFRSKEDVYKRQTADRANYRDLLLFVLYFGLLRLVGRLDGVIAVSYTHLDVYKRQYSYTI